MAARAAGQAQLAMSVDAFVEKWRRVSAGETQAAQSHFNDLCDVIGVPKPLDADPQGVDYAFEKGVKRPDGSTGQADVRKAGCFGWEYKGKRKNLSAAYEQLLGYREGLGNPPLLVVCDMNRFEIHTNFTNTEPRVIEFTLKHLEENPTHYIRLLREVFLDPEALHPDRDPRYITETAAAKFGEVAEALRDLDHDPNAVARFLNRLVFCFFAESMGLFRNDDNLTHRPVTITLDFLRGRVERSKAQLSAVFNAMSRQEITDFGPFPTPWFNGGLFDSSAAEETFPLTGDLVDILLETAELDWSRIEPAIFGTLFERGLDPSRRSQLGAHYTDPDNIMRVVEPVVLRPLRREFDDLREALEADAARVEEPRARYDTNGTLEMNEAAPDSAEGRIRAFHDRLAQVRVLDPACGSGNFLYVAMRELKQLEDELIGWADSAFAIKTLHRRIGPANMLGIDIDQFAVDLTRLSLWIGDIQWTLQHSLRRLAEPILDQIDQIECRDAILAEDGDGNPVPAEWPEAEFVVGNPPFLGGKLIRKAIGDKKIERLHDVWHPLISGNSDLCTYWHEQARRQIANKKARRAGLLATTSITQQVNLPVLERIAESGAIFSAWRNEPWAPDGAAVRIAIVAQDDGIESELTLDGAPVDEINPDLTQGAYMGAAQRLEENAPYSYRGGIRAGPFDVPYDDGMRMLNAPLNVNGHPNSDVVFPLLIGRDLAQRWSERFVIDFGEERSMAEAAQYELPFEHAKAEVQPWRKAHPNPEHPEEWWQHFVPQRKMRNAIAALPRWIATPETSTHRFFAWITDNSVPDVSVVVILRSDDFAFGVLASRAHSLWSLAQASRIGVGDDPRYMPTRTFLTFPFPWPLDAADDALTEAQITHRDAIAAAAVSLDDQREAWLNPPNADPDELRQRTMTNLYNDPPVWLQIAHREIDEAVFAAYGWPADLSDDEVLGRLLALNLERAGG